MKPQGWSILGWLLIGMGGLAGCSFTPGIPSTPSAQVTATARPTPEFLLNPPQPCGDTWEVAACGGDPRSQVPPICGLVPLSTTMSRARQILQDQGQFDEQKLFRLPGREATHYWLDSTSHIGILHDDAEQVLGVVYGPCSLTLSQLVATYGPPLLYTTIMCEGGNFDCSSPPYDGIDFVWPPWGVQAAAWFNDGILVDSAGQLLPFSPDFSINYISYTTPFSVAEYESDGNDWYSHGVKLAWPGFFNPRE